MYTHRHAQSCPLRPRQWCSAGSKGSKAKGSKELEPQEGSLLPQGVLELYLLLPISSAARDWLRSGIRLQLWRVVRTAYMQPLTDEQKLLQAGPKRKGKAGELHEVACANLAELLDLVWYELVEILSIKV
jgi:hypothetical protein